MRMVSIAVALTAGAPMFCAVAAADEAYDKLLEQFEKAEATWYEKNQAAAEPKEGESIPAFDVTKRPATEFIPRFRAYAEANAGKPAAIPALVWVINQSEYVAPPKSEKGELAPADWALERLTRDHAGQAEITESLGDLAYAAYSMDKEPLVRLYEKIISTNKDKDAQSQAMFNLGFTYYQSSGRADEEAGRKANEQRSTATFRRLIKEHVGTKAAEWAASYIYEIENLQIGMVAPEIVGKDVGGKEIKLSHFRGQVVVLDFWGFW